MADLMLKITLLSDTTFGRGDGVAGLVDAEVQHDATGCPFVFGRTVKGMIREECANLLFALEGADTPHAERWQRVGQALLGAPGSGEQQRAALIVGDAALPEELRHAIGWQVEHRQIQRHEVLDAFTAIRQQTAVNPETGAPQDETLRAARVILRGTVFWAPLHINEARLCAHQVKLAEALMLLAALVSGWQRAGTGRNRGRGLIQAALIERQATELVECTAAYLARFAKEMLPS